MNESVKPEFCFLLGIDMRSGTNFLFRLLQKHPGCKGPGPIWEDHFVQYSHYLRSYVDTLYGKWNPSWNVESVVGPKRVLMNYFGEAILKFLSLQLSNAQPASKLSSDDVRSDLTPKIILTKTPSVDRIEDFFELFPDSKLIVLIRDGRAVVESGVRSFGWSYEDAIRRWSDSARSIRQFKSVCDRDQKSLCVIRYEDLLNERGETLRELFRFLGLDPEQYDYASADSVGVVGSSDLKSTEESIHWKETAKSESFDPLTRFKDWDEKKHARFNWVAGDELRAFGYDLIGSKPATLVGRVLNTLLDLLHRGKLFGLRVKAVLKQKILGDPAQRAVDRCRR